MKKHRKINMASKLTAFVMAGAICFGSALWIPEMTVSAEAVRSEGMLINEASTGSLTVKKNGEAVDTPLSGATFSVYRVMELTPAAQPGDYAEYKKTEVFAEALKGVTADDLGNYSSVQIENLALELKKVTEDTNVEPDGTAVTGEDGSCQFTELALGYYLVVETAAPEEYVAGSPFLIAIPSTNNYNQSDTEGTMWVYDVVAEPKNAQVGIEKKLAEGEDGSVGIGDYVQYEVTTAVPNYPDEYFDKDVTFTIRDTMSDGLEIQKSTNYPIVVNVGGVQVEEAVDTYSLTAASVEGENPDLVISFAKDFVQTHRLEDVSVSYYAKINGKAVTGIAGNSNRVSLEYNHKAGESTTVEGTGVKVYTFGIDIMKFTKDESMKVLPGAVFELCADPERKILIASGISDAEGKIEYYGLDAGTYYLTEVESPAGYTLLANPIKIEIIADEAEGQATGTFTLRVDGKEITATAGDYISKKDVDTGIATVAVENHKGFSLPATGGKGIVIFLMIGIAGIVAVSVVVARKTKKN